MSFTKVKIVLLVLIVFAFSVTLNAKFTKEIATDLVLNQICGDKLDQVNIYSAKVTRSSNQIDIFRNYEDPISVNYSNYYFYYVDNTPGGFSGSYNEYVIIDIVSGNYQVFIRDWCPDDMRPHDYLSNYDLIHYVNDPADYFTSRVEFIENTSENRTINNNAYAVIIKPRFWDDLPGTEITHFWNDVSFIYSTLKMKGYTDDNIILLYDNDGVSEYGDDFDGDYVDDIDFACTEPNINIVFEELSGLTNNYPEIPELDQNNSSSFFSIGTGIEYGYGYDTPFIFCWNMYINPPGTAETIFPEELSEMLSNVNCGYMNIVLGQDFSGNFVEDIVDTNENYNYLCDNRAIITSTGIDQGNKSGFGGWNFADYSAEGWITDCLFSEFFYYYISAIRGYYPFIEFDGTIALNTTPWLNGTPTGEFNYSGFPHTESDDFYPDINDDDCTSTLEAFNYMQAQHCEVDYDYTIIPYNNYLPYNANRYIYPIVDFVTQSGFTEEFFCLNGFGGQVTSNLNIVENVILSEIGLDVINSTLTISPNLEIFLTNQSKIVIDESSSLNTGTNITFKSLDLDNQGDIELNTTGTTIFNNSHFEYCNLSSTNGNLTISNSDFVGCKLVCEDGDLYIIDSEFNGENSGYSSGIWCDNNSEVVFDNIIVENYYQGIRLNYPDVFEVSNSISRNNATQCLSVFNSRNRNNTIYNSQLYGSTAIGLLSYGSSLTATSCNISQNGRGVFLMNRSNVTIEKKPETHSWYLDSVIANNSLEEILFYDDCSLHLADNRNKIIDNSYTPGTSDEFLINCPNLLAERDFSYNFWGYTDMYGNAILPPNNRFYPEGAYNLSPVYNPGVPTDNEKTDDQILYETAVTEAENGNIVQAEIMLKDLIAQYPESVYKRSSASYLLAIQEEDFQDLKTYFNYEPNLHSDDVIELYTAYLQTYCDIQSENYQEAIDWLESIITNPPSLVDSVYAVIDLGDLYLQMGGNGRGVNGIYPHLIPNSKEEFEQTREELFTLLSEVYNYENEPEEEPSNNSLPTCATLNANYPNPFNPETTISFSIPDDSKIELSVFNIKGQKVKSLVKDSFESGTHSVVWDGKDDTDKSVSSGIYFYKLNVNGISKQIRKCILMK